MSRFQIVDKHAYNVDTKLFLEDSHPCDYAGAFNDGKIVACYENKVRFISGEYLPADRLFTQCCTTGIGADIYINDKYKYKLPKNTKTIFSNDKKFIAETSDGFTSLSPIKIYPEFPANTVIYGASCEYCPALSMLKINVADGGPVLFTNTSLPILSCKTEDNMYKIYHSDGPEFEYYITMRGNEYIMVSPTGGNIELTKTLESAYTSLGAVKSLCKLISCGEIKELTDDWGDRCGEYEFVGQIPGGKIYFDIPLNIKEIDDLILYKCSNKYFTCGKTIIFAENFRGVRGSLTKPAMR